MEGGGVGWGLSFSEAPAMHPAHLHGIFQPLALSWCILVLLFFFFSFSTGLAVGLAEQIFRESDV